MILKYCFKDEIHKSFITPPTFISLLKEVTTIFGDRLPPNFTLQYRDNDGDFVTISSDIEYLSMIKFDLPKAREMVRIYIIPSHQSQMMEEADVKPVDLSLSSKKSSDGSFEVIEENSQNTSGNISEFSLDSAKKSSSRSNSEAASSPKVVQDFNFNEENSSDSSVDFDESIHSHNDTIHKIEARVEAHRTPPLSMRQPNAGDLMDDDDDNDEKTLPMPQNNAGDLVDDEDSLEEDDHEVRRIEELQTSIDRILNFIQPADNNYANNNGKASPTQYYSLDNSVLSKEINQAAEELAAIRIRRIINRLKNLQPPSDKEDSSSSFNESADSAEEESIDLHDIKPLTYTEMGLQRRARIMSVVSAAIIIQKAYRNYRINKLIKVFRDFEASYPLEPSVTMKDQATQMIPLEYQYEFSASNTISEASSFSIKTPCEPKEEEEQPEEWNLQKIQPKDYRVSFEENSYEEKNESSPMKKCYHCEDFEFCEHYHSGYKTFNDSHMRMMAQQNYRFKTPSKFNYIPSPILKGRYDSYFMSNQVAEQPMKEADKSLNYRLLPGMSNTPVFLSSIDGKKIAYKTVYLINTGSRPWRKCYVKAMGPLSGRTAEIYNIDVGQIALATIELYGHYGADSYKSQWKIIHENENGMMEPVGEPFEVDITFEVKENMIDEEIMREMREQGDDGRQEQEVQEEVQEMQENKSMSLSMEERRLEEFRAKYIYQNSQNYEEEQDYYQDKDSMGLSVEQRNVHQTEEDNEEEEYEEDYEDEEDEQEEDQEEEEDYEEEEEEEEEENQQIDEENMPFANYQKYLEEIAKVKEIGRHFPCDPWDEIFDFVLERAYMSIEQIYEEYVSYRNAV